MDTRNTTHSPSGIQSEPIQERLSVQTKTGDIGNIFLERNSSSKDSGYFTSASEKDSGYLTAACEKDADYCTRDNEKDTSYYTVPSENDFQYGIAFNDIEFCTECSENEATRDNCTASNAIDPGFCTASSVQDGGYCVASVQDGEYCTASSLQEADYSTVRSISGDYNFASMDEDEVENSSIPDLDKHLSDCSGMPGILREKSELEGRLSLDYRRQSQLSLLRQELEKIMEDKMITVKELENLLQKPCFSNLLFQLFDSTKSGFLVQQDWIDTLKSSTRLLTSRNDFVELVEAVTYLISGDSPVDPDSFHKIISCRGVSQKIMNMTKTENESCSVEALMETMMMLTSRNERGESELEDCISRLRKMFTNVLGPDKSFFTLDEFRRIIPCKDDFFVRRIFSVFDRDGSGTVSLAEMLECVSRFSVQDNETKIQFLFKIYDADNNELLTEKEYGEVLRACMKENEMEFNEEELANLTNAIFQDGVHENGSAMTLDDFRNQMLREEGLLNNLSLMFNKWILPPPPRKKKTRIEILKEKFTFRHLSRDYWTNNIPLISFITFIIIINLILFIQRAVYFKDFSSLSGFTPNIFYMISRGCARAILFNTVLVLLLVLRYTISLLRKFGLGNILPLDHNIYLHKITGTLIFFQSLLHSIMHLCNFGINVQPDPVKFIQLTGTYWEGCSEMLGYNPPPGCEVVSVDSNSSSLCSNQSLEIPPGLTLPTSISVCQICPEGSPYTYYDWILTTRPGVFGLIGGAANPTGVALMVCLTIMFLCSLPVVRRSGHFQVFYFTHMLYFLYFILLIFHCPDFWKILLCPAIIWAGEVIYRLLSSFFGHGQTQISAGVLLPSRVTNLIIKRPEGFKFSPGDWVFIKIPSVCKTEWHPFTISSAPEVEGEFTLHIRGVGGWTNKLYKFFEAEHDRQNRGLLRPCSNIDQFYGSVKRRMTKSIKTIARKNKPEVDATFMNIANKYAVDEERQKQRMAKRAEKLRKMSLEMNNQHWHDECNDLVNRSLPSARYLSMKQRVIRYDTVENSDSSENSSTCDKQEFSSNNDLEKGLSETKIIGRTTKLQKPLEIYVDGPFGSPSSNIYRAEHAVLIGTGIGVTPFASILQSIMLRYYSVKQTCPNCKYQWSDRLHTTMLNLRKVDFFWINRDQKSFEWFVTLLSKLELEQAVHGGEMERFLDMHMYVTSALQKSDMKAVSLQLALDILHRKEDRDLVTGLRSRTNAGRPNWDKVFTKLRMERKGDITVFYCGNQTLGKILRSKCEQFGFRFRKEVF